MSISHPTQAFPLAGTWSSKVSLARSNRRDRLYTAQADIQCKRLNGGLSRHQSQCIGEFQVMPRGLCLEHSLWPLQDQAHHPLTEVPDNLPGSHAQHSGIGYLDLSHANRMTCRSPLSKVCTRQGCVITLDGSSTAQDRRTGQMDRWAIKA